MLDAGMRQADEILLRHQDVLDALAVRLLDDETIEGEGGAWRAGAEVE